MAAAPRFADRPRPAVLLASDRRSVAFDASLVAPTDPLPFGRVASRPRAGTVRRAVAGSQGPLVGEVRSGGGDATLEVWGPPATPAAEAAAALAAVAGWAGLDDDVAGFADVCARHPVTRRLHADVGGVRLPRLPEVGEALGRSVVAQLVQRGEAAKSTAQLVDRAGTPAPGSLWCWPTPQQVRGHSPALLRRCGISLRAARALHAGALEDTRLARAAAESWSALDRRLRALPGVGAWTAAETRLALGDPDAVSVGDYHLASIVGTALTGEHRRREDWSDEEMLALLEPFAGHRGRIVRLCAVGARRRLAARQHRRAPRARWSAHRYW